MNALEIWLLAALLLVAAVQALANRRARLRAIPIRVQTPRRRQGHDGGGR